MTEISKKFHLHTLELHRMYSELAIRNEKPDFFIADTITFFEIYEGLREFDRLLPEHTQNSLTPLMKIDLCFPSGYISVFPIKNDRRFIKAVVLE
jgi:hypothetical protein